MTHHYYYARVGLASGYGAGIAATYSLSGVAACVGGTASRGLFRRGGLHAVRRAPTVLSHYLRSRALGSSGTYNLNGGVLVLSSMRPRFREHGGLQLQRRDASGKQRRFPRSLPMTLGTSGGGATFNTAGYTVTLSGSLSGPGSLTLKDTWHRHADPCRFNTYTGGTTVTAGTLQLGDGVANNGYVQGNILNNGAVAFANPAAQTYSGVISGSGSLTKIGSGILALNGSNTYTGPTTISQGKLVVDGWLTNSAVSVTAAAPWAARAISAALRSTQADNLAPGDSLGTLNVSGNLILSSGAVMDYELDTPSTSDMIALRQLDPQRPAVLRFQLHVVGQLRAGQLRLDRRRIDQRQPGEQHQRHDRRPTRQRLPCKTTTSCSPSCRSLRRSRSWAGHCWDRGCFICGGTGHTFPFPGWPPPAAIREEEDEDRSGSALAIQPGSPPCQAVCRFSRKMRFRHRRACPSGANV